MRTNQVLILISLVLTGILSSCSEAFLDIEPQASLDENALKNERGVDAAIIAAYSMLDGWNNDWTELSPPWAAAGSNWILGSVISDDAYKGASPGDEPDISSLELFNWSANNPYLNTKYKALYEGIARTNAAGSLLLEATNINPEKSLKLAAEIRFLRAHYHFDAVKIWGNVPYYTEADEDLSKSNQAPVIPDILADLEAAEGALPLVQDEVGRATKGAAQAYMGKIHLYQGNWAQAKFRFEAVVNSGVYALNPCFREMFTTAHENGSEMIFSIQASVNDGTEGGENGNFGDRLNFPHAGSPFGCCGFHQPSQNLVNAFQVDAISRLPLLDHFNDSDVYPSTPVDPRLDWTIGRDNVPYLGWGIHEPDWIKDPAWAGPFSPKKFTGESGEQSTVGWSSNQLSPINIPLIRYSDVLLMLAEAEIELNNLERARELVNMIRIRAGACAQGSNGQIVSIDDRDITWANYKVGTYHEAWTDKARARKAVRLERRLELALEGHRFFDLRRWGIAQEVMGKYIAEEQAKRSYLSASLGFEHRHTLFPIPEQQIERSKIKGVAQLIQNKGW